MSNEIEKIKSAGADILRKMNSPNISHVTPNLVPLCSGKRALSSITSSSGQIGDSLNKKKKKKRRSKRSSSLSNMSSEDE